jgi:hypothetical protein
MDNNSTLPAMLGPDTMPSVLGADRPPPSARAPEPTGTPLSRVALWATVAVGLVLAIYHLMR